MGEGVIDVMEDMWRFQNLADGSTRSVAVLGQDVEGKDQVPWSFGRYGVQQQVEVGSAKQIDDPDLVAAADEGGFNLVDEDAQGVVSRPPFNRIIRKAFTLLGGALWRPFGTERDGGQIRLAAFGSSGGDRRRGATGWGSVGYGLIRAGAAVAQAVGRWAACAACIGDVMRQLLGRLDG